MLFSLLACAPATPTLHPPDMGTAEQAFPGRHGELTSVTLETEAGSHEVQVEVIDGQVILEGDMVLGSIDDFADSPAKSGATGFQANRWPGGVVPFSTALISGTTLTRVNAAIADWNADTSLQFIPRTTEANFINFVPGDGCSSLVGMHFGPQPVTLSSKCSTGNVRHEIGHAIGLFHEQQRSDRDDFVTIDFNATTSDTNYYRWVSYGLPGVDLGPYDTGSLMHYGSFFFATDPAVPVMLTVDGDIITPQRAALSDGDLWGVDRIYFDTWQVSWSGDSTWETLNYSGMGTNKLLYGDLNGDGEDDVFRATGSSWKVSWSGSSSWDTIASSGYTNVQLGDLDGDGTDDVFLATGKGWYVSWSGTSSWDKINSSSAKTVMLGDLDGDGADDVFRASGSAWYVSWSGSTSWDRINTSSAKNVMLGDLDGDGSDDVFRASGSAWYVSWSGTSSWDKIATSSYTDLQLADFDADGIDDVFLANGNGWYVSWSGTSSWDKLTSSSYTDVRLADFNGDGEADVMTQMDSYGI